MRFRSRGPSEDVRPFPDLSPRIRHGSELAEKAWKDAVQGLGKLWLCLGLSGTIILSLSVVP